MSQLENIEAIEKRLWNVADTLRPNAQFDFLMSLPDNTDRAKAIIEAMDSIEADYQTLRGVLPKAKYQELDNSCRRSIRRNSSACREMCSGVSMNTS